MIIKSLEIKIKAFIIAGLIAFAVAILFAWLALQQGHKAVKIGNNEINQMEKQLKEITDWEKL